MSVVKRWMVAIVAVLLVAACAPAPTKDAAQVSGQIQTAQAAKENVWGKVPYCNCFGDAMTKNVARELEEANLTAKLQEQSPREGWLYFVVSFDPAAATRAQIGAAIAAGGGEMLDAPP